MNTVKQPSNPSVHAILAHLEASEEENGQPFASTFVNPFNNAEMDNSIPVPVRLLHKLRDDAQLPLEMSKLAGFVHQQQTLFERWATKQGFSLMRSPTDGDGFMQSQGGLHMCTYFMDATEGAWRAWAHVAVQAMLGNLLGQQTDSSSKTTDETQAG